MKIKTYTATSSPNCQLFCSAHIRSAHIRSIYSKFAPPTPNLICPLIFRRLAHVSTLYQYKLKHIKAFFLPNANKYPHQIFSTSTPLAHSPHHSTHSYTVLDKGGKMHLKQFPCQFHPQVSILCSSCVYYGVFQTSLHMKRKLTLRNMNGSLYCCYRNSPYQLCPHIFVFMFKNYIQHRQTDRQTDRQMHTHNMYIITRMFQSF